MLKAQELAQEGSNLMKMMKVIFGIFLGLSILSCSKSEDTELKIAIVGKNAFLIDAPGQSCTNVRDVDLNPSDVTPTADVASLYFSYSGATISWTNVENTAYIVAMKIEFTGANLAFSCTIAGDELTSVFYDPATNTAWDGSLAKADNALAPREKVSKCPIRCGGVTVTNKSRAFTTTGKVTLIGFERNPAGEEFPLKTSASVKLLYE
jgi:hypothetical protein